MTVWWLALVCGAFVIAQAFYFQNTKLKGLVYSRSWSKDHIVEGESVQMVEQIYNGRVMPLPSIIVESRMWKTLNFEAQQFLVIKDQMFHRSVFFMPGQSVMRRRHYVTSSHRGVFVLDRAHISVGDLFGLVKNTREYQGEAALYVCPRLLSDDELPFSVLKWQGEVMVRRWILPDPILVNGIRPMLPDDSARDIHWGATARTGAYQVKVRQATADTRLLLVFNTQIRDDLWNVMSEKDTERLEYALRLSATLAHWAVNQALAVGFASNGTLWGEEGKTVYIEPVCSSMHLDFMLETLARVMITMQLGFVTFMDSLMDKQPCDICVLTAYRDGAVEEKAAELRSKGHTVTFIEV